MNFLVAIFQLGWQILRALLWVPATVLFGALLCLIAYWANRREEAMSREPQPVEEYIEFTEEELQRLAELRRRYVALGACSHDDL